ncbi:TRADD-N-associated membrane domain-containing protein [Alkalicoccobacillus gibsonii]|uniref:TRADD-N-associated membrane domain-containing protein n=1 Tax=Alkalicoccobacillus gibsonii TaxID=79881 RepID=UPI003F7C33A8
MADKSVFDELMNLDLKHETLNYKESLEKRKESLKEKIRLRNRNKRHLNFIGIIFIILSVIIPVISYSIGISNNFTILFTIIFLFYSVLAFLMASIRNPTIEEKELYEIENEIELSTLNHYSGAQRSEKLFKNHHMELKRYYDENLNQSRVIFRIGIVCIFAGFLIVLATTYIVWQNLNDELANKLIIGGLGSIAAILTNFVGVMYLRMHSETMKSLTQFHNRFVNTHHFHFGNFLISKIEDQKRREEALANLAISINQQNQFNVQNDYEKEN